MLNRILPFGLVFVAGAAFLISIESSSTARPAVALEPLANVEVGSYKLSTKLDILMHVSDSLFYGMDELVKANKYKTLNQQALFLSEMGNLLGHISGEKDWDSKDWDAYAAEMRASLTKLAEVTLQKDADAFKKQWKTSEEACEACHEDFRD